MDGVDAFFLWFGRITLALLVVATLFTWARHRSRSNLDALLLFTSLGLPVTVAPLSASLGWTFPNVIYAIALLAHPYFLVRVSGSLRKSSVLVEKAGLGLWVLTSVLYVVF